MSASNDSLQVLNPTNKKSKATWIVFIKNISLYLSSKSHKLNNIMYETWFLLLRRKECCIISTCGVQLRITIILYHFICIIVTILYFNTFLPTYFETITIHNVPRICTINVESKSIQVEVKHRNVGYSTLYVLSQRGWITWNVNINTVII